MPLPVSPDSPPEGSITCAVDGDILLIGINRPAKRNGFTPRMFRELGEAYTRLDDEPALRVGVLHAMGAHFTAGLDLPSIAPLMRRGENPTEVLKGIKEAVEDLKADLARGLTA